MSGESPLRDAQVMIVDDLADNVRIVVDGLRGHGVRPLAFTDPHKALEAARRSPPDAFVLDVAMPGLDGFALARLLLAEPSLAPVPILFLTASDDPSDVTRAYAAGASDYVAKPVRLPELVARLTVHVDRARKRSELEDANRQLEEAASFRDAVEAVARHDLKTPLTAVIGFSSMALERDLDAAMMRELTAYIHAAGLRMLAMVEQSLDLFRIEQGMYDDEPAPTDVGALVAEVVLAVGPTAVEAGVDVAVVDEGPCWVAADPALLYSALGNLLRNAVQAAGLSGGGVRIHRVVHDDRVTLVVENAGAVPADVRTRFFERGVTADRQRGTGLGTYSASRMVEAMGGMIGLDTTETDRTRVTITLPSSEPATPAD